VLYRPAFQLLLGLAVQVLPPSASAQATVDSASQAAGNQPTDRAPRTGDPAERVLACPHLQSLETEEIDYVRAQVYGHGSRKGVRWEVEPYTLTGRAFITTSVNAPRPPSREASSLRRRIQDECSAADTGS
jgi:hypothetical protein